MEVVAPDDHVAIVGAVAVLLVQHPEGHVQMVCDDFFLADPVQGGHGLASSVGGWEQYSRFSKRMQGILFLLGKKKPAKPCAMRV